MPPKRKSTFNTGGFAKKTKVTKAKYGGGMKKNADKYGAKGIDWDAAVKLAEKAANKAINKNIETQYSSVVMTSCLSSTSTATSGFNLPTLNKEIGGTRYSADNMIIFNLGYLSQQGSSLKPGYRIGQRLNAKYFRIVVAGNIPMATADCTYHWRIVRRKQDQAGQKAYNEPTIVTAETVALFKPVSDGPLAASSSYGSTGGSAVRPFPTYLSAMRQNTEAWTFTKGAYGSKFIKAHPLDIDPNDDKHASSFCETLYHPLEEEWEFVDRVGSDIKGGNYFFVLWREGAMDTTQHSVSTETMASMGGLELKVMFELAFKDGG
jgi:hypothetical protein